MLRFLKFVQRVSVVRNEQSDLELIEAVLLSHWCRSPTLGSDVLQSFGLFIIFPLIYSIIIDIKIYMYILLLYIYFLIDYIIVILKATVMALSSLERIMNFKVEIQSRQT